MKETKFSVNDKVKIYRVDDNVNDSVGHCVGKIGKINLVRSSSSEPYLIDFEHGENYWFREDEIRSLTKLDKALQ